MNFLIVLSAFLGIVIIASIALLVLSKDPDGSGR